MRTLCVFATLFVATLAAPSGLFHGALHAAPVPAATYLAAAPVEVKTVEVETKPVEIEVPAYAGLHHGYAPAPVHHGYAAPLVHAAPVEVKTVEVEEAPVAYAAPAPIAHAPVAYAAPAPVAYAAHAVAPVTTVEAKVGAPVPVQAGPTQKITHYGTVPQVTGYSTAIHKPRVYAPRIGVPTTLLNKVEHLPAEVTVEKYDVNVQQIEPNPVPYKVPVAGAPIYENTHIKHEPVIRTHTNVHHTAVAAPAVYHGGHHAVHVAPAHHGYAAPVHHAGYAGPLHHAGYAGPLHHAGLPLTYAAKPEEAADES